MLDLYSVINAPTDKLATAITGWSNAITKLEETKRKFEEQLIRPVTSSGWKGEAATAGTAFMKKVTSEVNDAIAEAKGIRKILTEANNAIKTAQTALTKIVEEEAQNKRLYVDSKGKVFKVNDYEGTHTPEEAKKKQAQIDDMERRIKKHVSRATEADTDAAWALNANTGKDKYNFSPPKHDTLKKADRAHAIADGNEAAAMAKKGGDELTGTELARFNKLVKENRNDPLFAEKFATELGGERSLEFWADVMNSHQGNIDKKDAQVLKDLQKNLGNTFATASHSDSPEMQRWKEAVIKHGNQQFITNPTTETNGPYGFQVMSSLLRHGEYDSTFLNKYGNALYDFEKNTSAPNLWANGGQFYNDLNFTDGRSNDDGKDPMTGFMEALGHSPEASTKFFSDEEKLNYLTGVESESGDGPDPRVWLQDNASYVPNPDQDQKLPGFDSLGHALESATTGHPYGEPPSPDDAVHSREQAQIMERIVANTSQNPDSVHPGLSDSLGRISGEYMPDIHRGISQNGTSEQFLYPIDGAVADLSERDVTRFLHKVGQDPDGYAAVNLGQRNYTTSLIELHAEHPELYVDSQDKNDRTTGYRNMVSAVSTGAGELEGTIGSGRDFALENKIVENDGKYNTALGHASSWASSVAGIGVGIGTSSFLGPGGIIVGGLTGTATSEVITGFTDQMQRDGLAEQVYKDGREWETLKEDTVKVTQYGVTATQLGDTPNIGDYQTAANEGVDAGFGYAQDNVRKYLSGEVS